jgi:hypothetical protein
MCSASDARVIALSRTLATRGLWLARFGVNIARFLSAKLSVKGLTTSPAPA